MTNKITIALATSAAIMLGGCAKTMTDDGMASSSSSAPMASDMPMARGQMAMANPKVGGAMMYDNKTIVENAIASPIHTTLVAAVKQAELVDTLSGPGPFTVFAPTDKAFALQDQATLAGLMRPEGKAQLAGILTYHVVPGIYTTQQLMTMIRSAPGGVAMLKTANGADIRLAMEGTNIVVMGANGSKGYINPTERNVRQSNGIIQVINGVLLPAM